MPDFILTEGDTAMFFPSFGIAMVVVRPGRLSASGPGTINGKKICTAGDESRLSVPGCLYTSGPYTIPGTGILKIDRLAAGQKASKTKSGGKAVLLKGSSFYAKFEVLSPALQPLPPPSTPVPDSIIAYHGKGIFITSNFKYKGT